MGFFENLTGALGKTLGGIPGLGLGLDWLGNKLIGEPSADKAFNRSVEGMTSAAKVSHDMYQQRYQDTMKDMKKAGLNPILAASGGFNVGSSPSVSSPTGFMPPSAYGSGASTAKNLAEIPKIRAETKRTVAEVFKVRSQTKVLVKEEEKVVREIFNLEQNFALMSKQIDKTIEEIKEVRSRKELQQADRLLVKEKEKEVNANKQLILKRGRELAFRLVQLAKIANVYSGPVGQQLTYIKEVLGSLNLNLGIIGGFKK